MSLKRKESSGAKNIKILPLYYEKEDLWLAVKKYE